MSSHQGWIRLDRAIFNWQWYTEQNVKSIFLHALLRANHAPAKWRGISIKRGQFFTSLDSLSHETGLSKQKIRTALKKLESTGELTSKPQAGGRMITVIKYNDYQDVNSQPNRQATGKQQATNRELTPNNHDNQNNHENNTLSDGAPSAKDGEDDLFGEVDTPPAPEPEVDREEEFLAQLWQLSPALARSRSSRFKVKTAWKKIAKKDRPAYDTVLESYQGWMRCYEWTRDNGTAVQGLHIWINMHRWEDTPQPAHPKQTKHKF